MGKRQYQRTDDGSLSLLQEDIDQLYHNRIGAFTEAVADYAKPALAILSYLYKEAAHLHLLDSCFGLGYNTLVFLQELLANQKQVSTDQKQLLPALKSFEITAIDLDGDLLADCLSDILDQPCFAPLKDLNSQVLFDASGQEQKNTSGQIQISSRFYAHDLRQTILSLTEKGMDSPIDMIFHDPFSPLKITEHWTIDLFAAYQKLMHKERGFIITYSSAPAVRAALRQLGFFVYSTTALGGKNGGTLASSKDLGEILGDTSGIHHLGEAEEIRLTERASVPYRDPHFLCSGEEIRANRLVEQGKIPVPKLVRPRRRKAE